MLEAGLVVLNGGLDAVSMSDGLRGAMHLVCGVLLAMLAVYIAPPVTKAVAAVYRNISVH